MTPDRLFLVIIVFPAVVIIIRNRTLISESPGLHASTGRAVVLARTSILVRIVSFIV